jgi:hypothetical protein
MPCRTTSSRLRNETKEQQIGDMMQKKKRKQKEKKRNEMK